MILDQFDSNNSKISPFLENIYWPQLIEFSNVLHNLRTNDYTFVKKSIVMSKIVGGKKVNQLMLLYNFSTHI